MKPTRYSRPNQRSKSTLDAYQVQARLVKAATPALGALLAAIPSVDVQAQGCTGGTLSGTICHQVYNVVLGSSDYFTADLDGDGDNEFRVGLTSSGAFILKDGVLSDRLLSIIRDPVDVGGADPYAKALNPTSAPSTYSVSAGAPNWTTRNAFITRIGQTFDVWKNPNRNAHVGLKLQIDGVALATHYGWINLRINAQQNITVVSAAYSTAAGAPILAGATTSLPVELTDFTAQANQDAVLLSWQTASESDNAGFEIQYRQSDDIAAWAAIGFVEGHGTTTEAQRYSHRAAHLMPGRHVFRLKQVDLDGTFAYSAEVEVDLEVPGTHVLSAAYPNPFNPRSQFRLAVAQDQVVRIAVFDALGQQVDVLHDGALTGGTTHTFAIDGGNLPSGTYLYRVTGESFAESRTISLVK